VRSPKDFFRPLAVGAPAPLREVPWRPSRMIHFFDPSNERMVGKLPALAPTVDVLLGNLEDAVPATTSRPRVPGLVEVARTADLGQTQLWTAVNSLDSPWVLDDLTTLVTEVGNRLDVVMVPKVEGPRTSTTSTGCWPSSRPRAASARPSRCTPSSRPPRAWPGSRRSRRPPRDAGHLARPGRPGRRPPDEDHPGRRRAPRLPGAAGPRAGQDVHGAARVFQQDLWHYTVARMVDACVQAGIYPYYGPFGDISDVVACEDQFRNAYLLGLRRHLDAAPGADRHRAARCSPRRRRTCSGPAGWWRRWAEDGRGA
jgi:malyl-CoA/(S)-citramalyl-CoA lyase